MVPFIGLILLFGACQEQKDEIFSGTSIEPLSQIDEIINQASVPFRVENNTLVFSSEDNFQKGIDFLNSLGDENFDEWEDNFSFNSLRSSSSFEKVHQKTDNLFATLLNSNSEIIIGANKFTVDFIEEKIYSTFIEDNEEVSIGVGSSHNKETIFSFNDDVFSILKNEAEPKATYCGGRDVASYFPFSGWLGDHIHLRVRYYTIGIYNTVTIRMEQNFHFWDAYIPL